jgi:hypothetical protein
MSILALARMKPKRHEEMTLSKLPNKRSGDLQRSAAKNPDNGKGNRPKAGSKTK